MEEKRLLLETVVTLSAPKTEEVKAVDTTNLKPIMPHIMPWSVRKNMLEANDRAAAQKLAQLKKEQAITEDISTEDLEKELQVVAHERAQEGKN